MPFGSYDAEKRAKLPTFLQYCNDAPKSVEGKTKFGVEIIWLPGKFPNVTLQTHAFRFVCSESNQLYADTIEYAKSCVDSGVCARLDIVIDSLEEKRITVSESTRVKGCWEKVGSLGLRFVS